VVAFQWFYIYSVSFRPNVTFAEELSVLINKMFAQYFNELLEREGG
jgi:hypothetical protein